MAVVAEISQEGVAVLQVAQDVVTGCGHGAYVLENGWLPVSGSSAEVESDLAVRRAYQGSD